MANHSKIQKGIIGVQILSSFFVLWSIYMLFAICDYQGGIEAIIFQPIIGGILSIIGLTVTLTIGLPIRLNRKLNNWWRRIYFIPIYLFILAILMITCSFIPVLREEIIYQDEYGEQVRKMIPNLYLATRGWFLSGFSASHFYRRGKANRKA